MNSEMNENINELQSPSRRSLFRACKSPMKKRDISNNERKDSSRKSLAYDLRKAFPVIDENFDILKKVGEGTFSKVYLAEFRMNPEKMFAFKHLVPTSSPGRIENELKCLQLLGGKNNVLGVNSALRKEDHVVFMLPYFPHNRFTDWVTRFSVEEIRIYMKELCVALQHVHNHKIIHRDVKPNNFLYWKEKKRFALIDFGLAMPVPGNNNSFLIDYTIKQSNQQLSSQSISDSSNARRRSSSSKCKHPVFEMCTMCKSKSRQKAPRAGTPGFRSPEVLLHHPQQTTAVDMWSAGVILLCMLSRRYPFFKVKGDMEALMQIVVLFGSKNINKMAESIGKIFHCHPPIEDVDSLKVTCQKLARRTCSMHSRHKSADVSEIKNSIKRKRTNSPYNLKNKRHASESVNELYKENIPIFENFIEVERKPRETYEEGETNNANDIKTSELSKQLLCTCVPDSAYDLLDRLLELNPDKRITAEESLNHPFINKI